MIETTPPLAGQDHSRKGRSSIYFLRIVGTPYVKIGTATTWRTRCREHQCGSPFPMEVLLVVPGGRRTEALCHHACAGSGVRGEWFKLTPAVHDLIARLTADPLNADGVATALFEEFKDALREQCQRGLRHSYQLLPSDHLEAPMCREAADQIILTVTPLSSAGDAE